VPREVFPPSPAWLPAGPACRSEAEIPLSGPNEMRSKFHRGGAYSSVVGGTIVPGPAPLNAFGFVFNRGERHNHQ